MQLYSTNNKKRIVSLEEAVFNGLPADNGLYLPVYFPKLPNTFIRDLPKYSLQEIAFEVTKALISGTVPVNEVQKIVESAINFEAPVVHLYDNVYTLELFHGPTLAFKDFGARFMAALMGYFLGNSNREIHILVATSGDTGGAVANGFFQTPGVKVTILYPSGKVSDLQEKQLTTLGGNITALEIDGTFDDCQKLVKTAFLDKEITSKVPLASANSINISRLIPQSFYYFAAYSQLFKTGKDIVFSVPSGNFGNICAGMIANKMGLPVYKFVASTNANDTFTRFVKTGQFEPKASVHTISNAMDVGNPSNFARIYEMFNKNILNVRNAVEAYSFSDDETRSAIRSVYGRTQYLMDPHGAVGYLGGVKYLAESKANVNMVFLETAHPAKFIDSYEEDLKEKVMVPAALAELGSKKKQAIKMSNDYDSLKQYLIG